MCDMKVVQCLLSKCSKVAVLSFESTNSEYDLADSIANHCTTLRELRFHFCIYIGDGELVAIARKCADIECLSITRCSSTFFDDIGQIVHSLLKLRRLVLSFWSSDSPLQEIGAMGSHSLQTVTLTEHTIDSGVHSLDVTGLRSFTMGCPNIVSLTLSTLSSTSQRTLNEALEYCPNLRFLKIGNISIARADQVLQSAAVYCPLLHTLNLTCTFDGRPEGFNRIVCSVIQIDQLVLVGNDGQPSDYRIADSFANPHAAVTKEGTLQLASCV